MNEMLKALYSAFYVPLPQAELKKEIEISHQRLIEVLDRPERRLVLKIIDAKDLIAEEASINSFVAGFRMAWKLSNEVNVHENKSK